VGLPAKSGVAGTVLVVVPNLMGFATFSPRLDSYGNSVRGVRFCRELVERFTFHQYDSLSGGRSGCKRDPRDSQASRRQRDLSDLRWGALCGDRSALRVRDQLLACMLAATLADGAIQEAEIDAMAAVYTDLMGHPPDPTALRQAAAAMARQAAAGSSPAEAVLAGLLRERSRLDDNARGLILESVFRVVAANGRIEPGEDRFLRAVAQALAISAGVLELEIDRFRQRRAPPPLGT
jgi:uncharacterized tellurite resistance protein B-like protein